MYLREKGQRVLRVLHILAAASWLGGVLCVLALVHAAPLAASHDEMIGMLRASVIIGQYVLVPAGAFGTFFTGLAYSLCTQRGFVRYRWITAKWIITTGMLLVGTVYLVPWAGQELDDVCRYGLSFFRQPDTATLHLRQELCCAVSAVMLVLCVMLAVFRPGESLSDRRASSAETRKGRTA